MELQGVILELKTRVNASGETVNKLSLLVFGNVTELHDFLQKPLKIEIKAE